MWIRASEGSAIGMTRYEREQFFDALCQLRERYSGRGPDDQVGILSIEAVVRWAEREMQVLRSVDAAAEARINEQRA